MAKPSSRTPLDKPADLAPAPDTGQPYGATEPPAEAAGGKKREPTTPLHVRIPVRLFQDLKDLSEETDISQTKLVIRALEAEVARRRA